MSLKRKLKNIKAAIWNIWFGHYFVFDPGKPTYECEYGCKGAGKHYHSESPQQEAPPHKPNQKEQS